jgi:hypothetical protein
MTWVEPNKFETLRFLIEVSPFVNCSKSNIEYELSHRLIEPYCTLRRKKIVLLK